MKTRQTKHLRQDLQDEQDGLLTHEPPPNGEALSLRSGAISIL